MYLIRQLAAKYNLTRTSLLHYDAIGLLSPSARTEAGYRLYSEEDEARLRSILLFRSMGVPLDGIGKLLKADTTGIGAALLVRIDELNREIAELKQRQRNIIGLIAEVLTSGELADPDKHRERAMALFAGIRPADWHEQFEATSPDLHKEFLRVLDSVSDSVRESIRASLLNSLPKEEQKRLKKFLQDK